MSTVGYRMDTLMRRLQEHLSQVSSERSNLIVEEAVSLVREMALVISKSELSNAPVLLALFAVMHTALDGFEAAMEEELEALLKSGGLGAMPGHKMARA